MKQMNRMDKAPEKALSALAFLEANRQTNIHMDRLEYFMPLVEEAVSGLTNVSFSLDDLQEMLKRDYRIELPETVLSTLASRCCKRKYLEKINGTYHRTGTLMPYSTSIKKRDELEERVTSLLDSAVQYAKSTGQFAEGDVNDETLRVSLLSFIETGFGDASFSQFDNSLQPSSSSDEFWADFITSQHSKDDSVMSTIDMLARGTIIRDAVFFPGLITDMNSFQGLVVYLDSPVVCWCLGISTVENECYTKEALGIFKKSGVICRVLAQTVDEIHNILYGIEANWDSLDFKSLPQSYSRCMKMRGFTKESVFELIGILEEKISDLGLRVVNSRPRDEKYVAMEDKLAERLRSEEEIKGSWSPRVQHDVNCIAEVLGTRKGVEPRRIGDAKAVFAAISPRTIANINKWWHEDESYSEGVIPPVLNFRNLTNYVWLSNPSENFEQIGNASVLITCATMMVPSETVWNAYMTRLNEMVKNGSMTVEKAAAIIQGNDLQSILKKEEDRVRETSIDDESFFNDVTEEAIHSISKPALENQGKIHQEEIERISEKHRQEIDAANTKIDDAMTRAEKLQTQLDTEREDRKNDERRAAEKEKQDAEIDSRHKAIFVSSIIAVLFLLIVITITYFLTDGFADDGSYNNAFRIAFCIPAAFSIVGLIVDFTVIKKRIQQWFLAKTLEGPGTPEIL